MSSFPPPPPGMDIAESAVPRIVTGMAIVWALSYTAVVLRFIARRKGGTKYWWDDYFCLAAALALISCLVEEGLEFSTGTGRHIWWVMENHPDWLESAQPRYIYADQKNYPVIIGCIKMSVLFLYLRLFGVNRPVTIACYVQMAMVLVWAVVVEFLFIFQCTPIGAALTETRAGGTCFQFDTLFLGTNVVNVIMDFGILITPLYPVWNLQLSRRRKLFVTGILLLGGGESLFSVIRVVKLSALSFIDATWDNGAAVIWSDVEANVGLLCICIPVLGPLLPKRWLGELSSGGGSYNISKRNTSRKGATQLRSTSRTDMESGEHASKERPPSDETTDYEMQDYENPAKITRTTEVRIENSTNPFNDEANAGTTHVGTAY